MKRNVIGLLFIAALLSGCKIRYVPVETLKVEKEYINQWLRDSIYIHDSVSMFQKGDTVWKESIKTVYKDRIMKDSILITDSVKIEIPYPVEVIKEVNRLNSFQSFQIWCGRIILLILIGWLCFKFIKKKFLP